MIPQAEPNPKRSRHWQWMLIALIVALSFSCVFFSTQAALLSEPERVIAANILADSSADYHLEAEGQIVFAPLNGEIIFEATRDAIGLRQTITSPQASITPVFIFQFPPTPTKTTQPTQVKTSPPWTAQATETIPVHTHTPVPNTKTPIPPTDTIIPPTLTRTPVPPTRTPWPPTPTSKPQYPTNTSIPATATDTPTIIASQTPTPTSTSTPTPTGTSTSTSTSTVTASPSQTSTPTETGTSTPTSTNTPLFTETSTPTASNTPTLDSTNTPTSTFTPIPTNTPVYRNLRPFVNCAQNNGDGTVTAYFGYINNNSFDVNIGIGPTNGFLPLPVDRGQPTLFTPGRHDFEFSVTFAEDLFGLIWWLDGNVTAAWTGSPACP